MFEKVSSATLMDIVLEKNAFVSKYDVIGPIIGSIIGSTMANPGMGWEGAGVGAVKGLGIDLGAVIGGDLGKGIGDIGGKISDSLNKRKHVEGGWPAIGGGLTGLGIGAYAGYRTSNALIKLLIGQGKYDQIFD